MSGIVCLQGGREFTDRCNEMDRAVIAATGASRIAVLAGAARVGDDRDGAVRRAVRHYEQMGVDGRGIPDSRVDRSGALDALRQLDVDDLIVLPGGSPSSLHSVLDGDVRELVVEHHHRGGSISGASAGAMVLCARMIRPDRGDVVDGLGLVAGLALPHWSAGNDRGWEVGEVDLWGLPECGGVLLEEGVRPTGVGEGAPSRRVDGVWHELPRVG